MIVPKAKEPTQWVLPCPYLYPGLLLTIAALW